MAIGFVLIALLILLSLVGIGVYLIRASRRHVGDEPRCGHCDYILTGLTSNRCPECGLLFIEAGIVKGSKTSVGARRRVGIALVILISLGILLFAGLATTSYLFARAQAERQKAIAVQRLLQQALTTTQSARP